MNKEIFIKKISNAILRQDLAYFLGAGISVGSGFSDWKSLMKDIAEELGLSIDKENDMISIAQFYKNKTKTRNNINQKILDEFERKSERNPVLSILCQLPVYSIWTTNYDTLIEKEFERLNKIIDVKRRQKDLSLTKINRSAILYKIHGDVTDPDKAVIIRDDYENFEAERGLFTKNLIGELTSKSFLFVGYSFSDPNLHQILGKIRVSLFEKGKEHFYISKKETDEYERTKQKLRIDDLKEYGIQTLEIDDYSELEDIFNQIRHKVFNRNVFIAGSAFKYTSFGTDDKAKELIKKLSYELIKNDYKIINGHGVGVGEYVIQGIVQGLAEKSSVIEDPYEIKIFPQTIDKKTDRKEMWTALRRNLISKSRFGIFMFGNKMNNGQVELAGGMNEEFSIAKEHDLIVIPIVSTGYQAEKIYEQNKDFCKTTENLKRNEVNDIVSDIIDIIKKAT